MFDGGRIRLRPSPCNHHHHRQYAKCVQYVADVAFDCRIKPLRRHRQTDRKRETERDRDR